MPTYTANLLPQTNPMYIYLSGNKGPMYIIISGRQQWFYGKHFGKLIIQGYSEYISSFLSVKTSNITTLILVPCLSHQAKCSYQSGKKAHVYMFI